MRVFQFTEQPYPAAWLPEHESLRVVLPSRICDPDVASRLYARYFDEWQIADELGFDIMVNEHHATATCLSVSCTVTLGILARITKQARLLALGVPLGQRTDPVRVAEELSMIDVISRGRLEMGFVKGVPYEIPISNANPVGLMNRLWEGHDLIVKAMTSHDGPFNWESRYFQYRNVNVWPRPFQWPHPPVWITATSPGSVRAVAERGHIVATFMTGYAAKDVFANYRHAWREARGSEASTDRFAYMALAAVASTHDAAFKRADKVAGYLRTLGWVPPGHSNPPGYISPQDNVRALRQGMRRPLIGRSGKTVDMSRASVEELIDAGLMFAGTPNEVYDQIADYADAIGGLGNLMIMGQAGHVDHDETVDTLRLFGTEVLPRLKELYPTQMAA